MEQEKDDFESEILNLNLYSPRNDYHKFIDLSGRRGHLLMRGQESLSSLNKVSLLAHKLTSLNAEASVKLEFFPEIYQHYAGICIYYDNMDYLALRKTYSEHMGCEVVDLLRVRNGERSEILKQPEEAGTGAVWFKVIVRERETTFAWSNIPGILLCRCHAA